MPQIDLGSNIMYDSASTNLSIKNPVTQPVNLSGYNAIHLQVTPVGAVAATTSPALVGFFLERSMDQANWDNPVSAGNKTVMEFANAATASQQITINAVTANGGIVVVLGSNWIRFRIGLAGATTVGSGVFNITINLTNV